jgi:hypothetical protein
VETLAKASFDRIVCARLSSRGAFDQRLGARRSGFARRRLTQHSSVMRRFGSAELSSAARHASARDLGGFVWRKAARLTDYLGSCVWLAAPARGAHSGSRWVRSNKRSRGP